MDIVSIGECMIEMFADEDLETARMFTRTFAGDALNTLAAAAKLGSRCGFITRVGDDPFGRYLLAEWKKLGIDTSQVRVIPGCTGLYFISLLAGGERQFIYYRKGSAASTLSPEDLDGDYLRAAKIVFATGITQAISPSARQAVKEAFRLVKQGGAAQTRTSFDPNLRLSLWSVEEARAALEEILIYLDIILPSAPEEVKALFGLEAPEEAIEYFWRRGVTMVAVKCGASGCVVGYSGQIKRIPAYSVEAVDTTGAGDAFNGAFLYGIASGLDPFRAARLGTITAALKSRGRGGVLSLPSREEVYEIFSNVAG